VGTNSWLTEAEADTYMADRLAISDYWNADAEKSAALVTAYRWLTASNRFSFPTTATQAMKDAQTEYALYLIQHQPDLDLRMGLQAQSVTKAGIVKETYDLNRERFPFPPVVEGLLEAYLVEGPFHIFDVERDEEQLTSYNAPGNLTRDT